MPGTSGQGENVVHDLAIVTRERVVIVAFTEVLSQAAGWAQWLLGEDEASEADHDAYRRPLAYALREAVSIAAPVGMSFTAAVAALTTLVVGRDDGSVLPISWQGDVGSDPTASISSVTAASDAAIALATAGGAVLAVTASGDLKSFDIAADGSALEYCGLLTRAHGKSDATPVSVAVAACSPATLIAAVGTRDGSVDMWVAHSDSTINPITGTPRWRQVESLPPPHTDEEGVSSSALSLSWRAGAGATSNTLVVVHSGSYDSNVSLTTDGSDSVNGMPAVARFWKFDVSGSPVACVATVPLPLGLRLGGSSSASGCNGFLLAWISAGFTVVVAVHGRMERAPAGDPSPFDAVDSDDESGDATAPTSRLVCLLGITLADAAGAGGARSGSHNVGEGGSYFVTADALYALVRVSAEDDAAAAEAAAVLPRQRQRGKKRRQQHSLRDTGAAQSTEAASADDVSGSSSLGAPEHRTLPSQTSASSPVFAWQAFPLSPHYVPNAPLTLISSSTDGTVVAVAGTRGAATFSLRRREWHVFSTPRQEQSLRVASLAWLDSRALLIVNRVGTDSDVTYELHAYPRAHLDFATRLCLVQLGLPKGASPRALACGATYLHAAPGSERDSSAGETAAPAPTVGAIYWLAVAFGEPGAGLSPTTTSIALYRLVLSFGTAVSAKTSRVASSPTVDNFPRSFVDVGAEVVATSADFCAPSRASHDDGVLNVVVPPLAGQADVASAAVAAHSRGGGEVQARAAADYARSAGLRVLQHPVLAPEQQAENAVSGESAVARPLRQVRTLTPQSSITCSASDVVNLRTLSKIDVELVAVLQLPDALFGARESLHSIGFLGGNFTVDRAEDSGSVTTASLSWRSFAPNMLLTTADDAVYVLDSSCGVMQQLALSQPGRTLQLHDRKPASPLRAVSVTSADAWGGSPLVSVAMIATQNASFIYTPREIAVSGSDSYSHAAVQPLDAPGGTGTPAPRMSRRTDSSGTLLPHSPLPGLLVCGRPLQLGDSVGVDVVGTLSMTDTASDGAGSLVVLTHPAATLPGQGIVRQQVVASERPPVPAGVRLVATLHAALKLAIVVGLSTQSSPTANDTETDDPIAAAVALGSAALRRGPLNLVHAALRQLLHDAIEDEPDQPVTGSSAVAVERLRRARLASSASASALAASLPLLPHHWLRVDGVVPVDSAAALAPTSLALMRTLGAALLRYMEKKRVPIAAVFGTVAAAANSTQRASAIPTPSTLQSQPSSLNLLSAPGAAGGGSPYLEAVLILLQRLDVTLDVVSAVGRTVEEGRLNRLFPAAGVPRALFREALRRGAMASGSVSASPMHSVASVRFIRVAASLLLLVQEYAWRRAHGSSGHGVPSAAEVVHIVNSNLGDATDLLAACGVPRDVASLLVGPPIPLPGVPLFPVPQSTDAVEAAAALVDNELLATVSDDDPATLRGLRAVVATTTAYCERLRSAATEHVASATAAAEAEAASAATGLGKRGTSSGLLASVAYVLSGGWSLLRGGGGGDEKGVNSTVVHPTSRNVIPALRGTGAAALGPPPTPYAHTADGTAPSAATSDAIVALLSAVHVPLLVAFETLLHRRPPHWAFGLVLAPVNAQLAVHGAGRGGGNNDVTESPPLALSLDPAARPPRDSLQRATTTRRGDTVDNFGDDGDLAAVAAALREVTVQQQGWLVAQISDATACIGGLADSPLVTAPISAAGSSGAASIRVGDIIQRVDGHSITSVPFDIAVAALAAAPRATPLSLLRIVDVPAIEVLAALLFPVRQ